MRFQDLVEELSLKPRVVKVNASSTFPARARCRFCSKGPKVYYVLRMPTKWFNPRRIVDIATHAAKLSKRMCQDFYLVESPSEFTGLVPFSGYPICQSYDPSLHTKRGIHPIENVIEYLACQCGQTGWAFVQRHRQNRPEINNRKARYNYPYEFKDCDWF